jgi:quinol-cytochrome oxidoreductase complex cytochrome b subunit
VNWTASYERLKRSPLFALVLSTKWGAWSLVCLYLSLFSGIAVGLQYDLSEPFYSTVALDLLIPYGKYFRSLHFYSSQFFFFFAVIHYICALDKTGSYSNSRRILLVLTLPVILVLLFTGYVLRGDSTGASAGMIAEHILLALPAVGRILNEMLFSISDHGMQRVYLHHVISFDILLLILAWDHLRRYPVKLSSYIMLTAIVLSFSIFIDAPLDPEELGRFYITGPWFFLGLQELLRYLPPVTAGVLIPCFFVVLLAMLSHSHRWFMPMLGCIAAWLLIYLLLSISALLTHG